MRTTGAALLCLPWMVLAAPAAADCYDLEGQEAKVAAASNCGEAHALYQACIWGSTADVQRGAIVQEICEKGFLPRLGPAQKKAYARRIAACERKYRNEDGTMYRSMEAVCAAGTAHAYWKKYGSK